MELERQIRERFEVVQAKEKLWTLRLYVSRHADATEAHIAVEENSHRCAVHGKQEESVT
jgi:hypothetical protein